MEKGLLTGWDDPYQEKPIKKGHCFPKGFMKIGVVIVSKHLYVWISVFWFPYY